MAGNTGKRTARGGKTSKPTKTGQGRNPDNAGSKSANGISKTQAKKKLEPYVDPNDPTRPVSDEGWDEEEADGVDTLAREQDIQDPTEEPTHIKGNTQWNKQGNSATESLGKPHTTKGPRKYTQKLADSILHRIMCGETLTAICRDERMPSHGTVMAWVRQRRDFAASYSQARLHQQHTWADQNIDIADYSAGDYARLPDGSYQLDRDGNPVFLKEVPQRAKLRIEARQWTMQRINRESYGDRIGVDMTTSVEGKDDAELIADLAQAMEANGMAADDLNKLLAQHGKQQAKSKAE